MLARATEEASLRPGALPPRFAFLFISGSEALRKIAFFFAMVGVARHLGVGAFGQFALWISVSMIVAVWLDLGLNELSIRDLSRQPDLTLVHTARIMVVKAALVASTFVIAAALHLGGVLPSGDFWVYCGLQWFAFSLSLTQFIGAVLRAHGRSYWETFTRLGESVALVSVVAFATTRDVNVVGFAWLFGLSGTLGLCLSGAVFVRQFGVPFFRRLPPKIFSLARRALPFAIAASLAIYYTRFHVIAVAFISGDEDAGLFNAAYQIITGALIVPVAIAGAIFPVLSRIRRFSSFVRLVSVALGAAWLLAIVGTTILILGSEQLLRFLYGPDFGPSASLLRVLALSIPLMYTTIILGPALQARNRPMLTAAFMAANALVATVADLLLVPRYGAQGAAWGVLVAEGVGLMVFALIISSIVREERQATRG